MTKYVALIRGIGPGDPRMSNQSLRTFFESLGLDNVQSLISSGNILFESDKTDTDKLEATIEAAMPKRLGFLRATIVRSEQQLQKLVEADPFKGLTHGSSSYLMVTFFKQPTEVTFKLPYQPEGKPYKLIGSDDRVLYSVTDNSAITTTDLMTWLEKQFGKDISSRTWNTVQRIVAKMSK